MVRGRKKLEERFMLCVLVTLSHLPLMTGTGIQVFRGSYAKSEIEGDVTRIWADDDEETLENEGNMTLDGRRRLPTMSTQTTWNGFKDFLKEMHADPFYPDGHTLHGRCGSKFLLTTNGIPATCDPNSVERGVCCSKHGWCGKEIKSYCEWGDNYGDECVCQNGTPDTENMCAKNKRNFCIKCNPGYVRDDKSNCVAGDKEDAVPFRKIGQTCGNTDEGAICEPTLLCMLKLDKSQPCPKFSWSSFFTKDGNPNCACITVSDYQKEWEKKWKQENEARKEELKQERADLQKALNKFLKEQEEKEKKMREENEREKQMIREQEERLRRKDRLEEELKWKTKSERTQLFVLSIGGGILILALLILVIYFCCFRKKRKEREIKSRAEFARAEEMAAAEGTSIGEGFQDDGELTPCRRQRMAEQRNYNGTEMAASGSNNPQPSAPPSFDHALTPGAAPVYMIEVGGNVTTAVDGARYGDSTSVVTGQPVIGAREVPGPNVAQTGALALGPQTEGDDALKSTKGGKGSATDL